MIRDPSDGSVREAPQADLKPAGRTPGPDTGLRQPTRTEAQERLERSREWLRDYRAKKERGNAARGSDDQSTSDLQDRGCG
jgi:hypothetical protein